jgi:hypothetical protein
MVPAELIVDEGDVEVELPGVFGLQLACFELDDDIWYRAKKKSRLRFFCLELERSIIPLPAEVLFSCRSTLRVFLYEVTYDYTRQSLRKTEARIRQRSKAIVIRPPNSAAAPLDPKVCSFMQARALRQKKRPHRWHGLFGLRMD